MTLNGVRTLIFFRRFQFLCWRDTSQCWNMDIYIVHKYCLSVPVFHFLPLLTHPAAPFLCDSWANSFFLFVPMQTDEETDRQTDRNITARSSLHSPGSSKGEERNIPFQKSSPSTPSCFSMSPFCKAHTNSYLLTNQPPIIQRPFAIHSHCAV